VLAAESMPRHKLMACLLWKNNVAYEYIGMHAVFVQNGNDSLNGTFSTQWPRIFFTSSG
jgi:hypothetical protein